jgi:predicted HAD superfamily Cof-like phosphohydrolase
MNPSREQIIAAMRVICDAVGEFHEKFGVEERKTPGFPSEEIQNLRWGLEQEESSELIEADDDYDLPGVLDGIGDLIVVLVGRARVYGLPLPEAFAEICASNLSKLGDDGKPIYREDSKVMKGPNFRAPDIAGILRAHGWEAK